MRYRGNLLEIDDSKPTKVIELQYKEPIQLVSITLIPTVAAPFDYFNVDIDGKEFAQRVPNMGCAMELKLRKQAHLGVGKIIRIEYLNRTGTNCEVAVIIEGDT